MDASLGGVLGISPGQDPSAAGGWGGWGEDLRVVDEEDEHQQEQDDDDDESVRPGPGYSYRQREQQARTSISASSPHPSYLGSSTTQTATPHAHRQRNTPPAQSSSLLIDLTPESPPTPEHRPLPIVSASSSKRPSLQTLLHDIETRTIEVQQGRTPQPSSSQAAVGPTPSGSDAISKLREAMKRARETSSPSSAAQPQRESPPAPPPAQQDRASTSKEAVRDWLTDTLPSPPAQSPPLPSAQASSSQPSRTSPYPLSTNPNPLSSSANSSNSSSYHRRLPRQPIVPHPNETRSPRGFPPPSSSPRRPSSAPPHAVPSPTRQEHEALPSDEDSPPTPPLRISNSFSLARHRQTTSPTVIDPSPSSPARRSASPNAPSAPSTQQPTSALRAFLATHPVPSGGRRSSTFKDRSGSLESSSSAPPALHDQQPQDEQPSHVSSHRSSHVSPRLHNQRPTSSPPTPPQPSTFQPSSSSTPPPATERRSSPRISPPSASSSRRNPRTTPSRPTTFDETHNSSPFTPVHALKRSTDSPHQPLASSSRLPDRSTTSPTPRSTTPTPPVHPPHTSSPSSSRRNLRTSPAHPPPEVRPDFPSPPRSYANVTPAPPRMRSHTPPSPIEDLSAREEDSSEEEEDEEQLARQEAARRRRRMFMSPVKAAREEPPAAVATPVAPGGWGWTPGGKRKGLNLAYGAVGGGKGKGREVEEEGEEEEEPSRLVQKREEVLSSSAPRIRARPRENEEETVWRVRRGGAGLNSSLGSSHNTHSTPTKPAPSTTTTNNNSSTTRSLSPRHLTTPTRRPTSPSLSTSTSIGTPSRLRLAHLQTRLLHAESAELLALERVSSAHSKWSSVQWLTAKISTKESQRRAELGGWAAWMGWWAGWVWVVVVLAMGVWRWCNPKEVERGPFWPAVYAPSPAGGYGGGVWGALPPVELSAFAIPEKLARGGGGGGWTWAGEVVREVLVGWG